MKAIFIVAIVLGAVLISAAAITVGILEMDEGSDEETDLSVPPTAPVYNSGDNAECQSIITEYYENALQGYNSETTGKAKLEAAWQGVLTAQLETGVSIINNYDFLDWNLSHWADTYFGRKGDPAPEFTEEVLEAYAPEQLGLPPAELITDLD